MSSRNYYGGSRSKSRSGKRPMSRKKRRRQVMIMRCVLAAILLIVISVAAVFIVKGLKDDDVNNNPIVNNTTPSTTDEATEAATEDDFYMEGGVITGKTEKGYNIVEVDGITYIKGIMIVNKSYSLPSTYNPGGIYPEVKAAFEKMKEDAKKEGLNIWLQSGFRTYERQETLYNNYVAADGKSAADTYSARPGFSEHQSGYCFDLNTIDDSFTNTAEAVWVAEHAHEYGFIIRYPEGKQDKTGYMYESWHLRYVGEEMAKDIYEKGECLEEYLGIKSEYAD
ncbi:MAG: D-alanyl-D-alanine carboxypeptidase family protein [Lachnospira sp.]